MNIRKASSQDIDAIYALGKTVDEFSVNKETVSFWPKELLNSAIQSDDVLILVAEDEESVIGFLIVNYNRGLKKALIENIYVQPDKRSLGVSDSLLKFAFELLSATDCKYIATLVPPDAQQAIDLYKRSGFSQGETFVWLDLAMDADFKNVD